MSIFLGQSATGGFNNALLQQSDDRNVSKNFQWDFAGTRSQMDPWANGMLWPSSRMALGGTDGFFNVDVSNMGRYESDGFDFIGGQQVKKIIGQTLDINGNALASCIIQGFLTSNDLYIGQTASDAQGYYVLTTVYPGAHYLVAYLAGSPDVAGTTVDTIIPV